MIHAPACRDLDTRSGPLKSLPGAVRPAVRPSHVWKDPFPLTWLDPDGLTWHRFGYTLGTHRHPSAWSSMGRAGIEPATRSLRRRAEDVRQVSQLHVE